jgi:hypothetical protein
VKVSLVAPETINGAVVPPEPPPELNNATLAGFDTNGNGVRDDVERVLASQVVNTTALDGVMQIAQTYQRLLTAPSISQSESDTAMLAIECFAYRNLSNPTGVRDSSIKSMTLNMDARLQEMRRKTAELNFRATNIFQECK